MSIYRWAKLDDQSGPDRSIELRLDSPFEFLLPIRGANAIGRLHPFHDDTNAEICSELSLKVLYLLSYPLVNILFNSHARDHGEVVQREDHWPAPSRCGFDSHLFHQS